MVVDVVNFYIIIYIFINIILFLVSFKISIGHQRKESTEEWFGQMEKYDMGCVCIGVRWWRN